VCWGMAEVTLVATSSRRSEPPRVIRVSAEAMDNGIVRSPARDPDAKPIVSCGWPQADTSIRIVDPESGEELPEGRVGEVWIAGSTLCEGYWGRPAESRDAFPVDETGRRFHRSGDLGFVDGGELFVTGRLKELIIVRGRNLYPQDLEDCAQRSHPAARPGCGIAFELRGERCGEVVLVQELRPASDPAEGERAIHRGILESFGITLADLVLVAPGEVPKTSSGKLRRSECRTLYETGRLDRLAGGWRALVEVQTTAPGHPAGASHDP
jgi:acyl-CoA synthetase (AMP-forming)/AMP-acid ligase II